MLQYEFLGAVSHGVAVDAGVGDGTGDVSRKHFPASLFC